MRLGDMGLGVARMMVPTVGSKKETPSQGIQFFISRIVSKRTSSA